MWWIWIWSTRSRHAGSLTDWWDISSALLFSQKIHRGLSAGRVQSVALRMIVDREEEIRAFKPEEYWSLDAKFLTPSTRRVFAAAFYGNEQGKIKIENKEQADAILSQLDGAQYRVKQSKRAHAAKARPRPLSHPPCNRRHRGAWASRPAGR